jgi:hypothetical protein
MEVFAMKKIVFAIALSIPLCLAHANSAEARDDAFKAANRAAIQMWMQQKANQGIYFSNPAQAMQALQFDQATGGTYNPYGSGFGYGYNTTNPYGYYPNYSGYGWGY